MANKFETLCADESGAAAIEYGLIAALVSVAAIGALTSLGQFQSQYVDINWALVNSP